MNSPAPTAAASDTSILKSTSPGIPRIIREHFDPDHLISKIEIQQSYNKLQYDRSLKPQTRELIQEHMEKVERDGLISVREVSEEEWSHYTALQKKREEEGNG